MMKYQYKVQKAPLNNVVGASASFSVLGKQGWKLIEITTHGTEMVGVFVKEEDSSPLEDAVQKVNAKRERKAKEESPKVSSNSHTEALELEGKPQLKDLG